MIRAGRLKRRAAPVCSAKAVFMSGFTCGLAVILIALTSPVQVAGPALPELVGSWKIVSYEDRDAAGVVVYPYGKTPGGLLIYDPKGHMAVQLMKTPPPDVASDDWDRFTVQEKVALYDGYVAYFGRYEVDLARKVVTHLPEGDLCACTLGGVRSDTTN
jgi:hypothetical protein